MNIFVNKYDDYQPAHQRVGEVTVVIQPQVSIADTVWNGVSVRKCENMTLCPHQTITAQKANTYVYTQEID